jgi:hypothetical protein
MDGMTQQKVFQDANGAVGKIKFPITVGCMRRFACRNFQITTNDYSKLSYTPCYMYVKFTDYETEIRIRRLDRKIF